MRKQFSRTLALAALGAVPAVVQAQTAATITGRVTNEAGQPVSSVQVFIQTLGVGTITRENGTYTLTVPAARVTGQTVVLSTRLVGYRAQTAQITLRGGAQTANFQLVAAPTTLSAVVVTGAGTVSTRERLGNVINSVDSTTIRRAAEPQNVVSALAGKAPNVEVRTQSGEPGSSAAIFIRGRTSIIGTNQPLFVVDGQPIDNSTVSTNGGNQSTVTQNRASDINPNDIASVEILKGAAAAAIYGARAANGVVLITTRSGQSGQTRYSLESTVGTDNLYAKNFLQRDFGLGSEGVTPTCFGPTAPLNCRVGIGNAGSWGPSLAGQTTYDQLDAVFKTGTQLNNQVQVTGGTGRTNFFLSAGQTRQNGVFKGPNNAFARTNARLKASQQLSSRFTIGGNLSYNNDGGRFVQKGSNISGLLLGTLRTPPNFDNSDYLTSAGVHRSYRFPNPSAATLTVGRGYDNPFFTLNNSGNRQELGRFIGNVNADYRPIDWLRIQYTLGADNYSDDRREALPLTSSSQPDGRVISFTQNNLEIDHNLIATAQRDFNPNFSGSVTVGQNLNTRRYRSNFVQGITLVAPEPLNLQNTLSYTPTQFQSTRNIAAYFTQLTADLYNQVYLTAGVRNDGFSTFGASKRFALFPKASVAWAFTNALGKTDQRGLFSFGKLRFAYGEVGTEPPVYQTITALSVGQLAFGSGFGDLLNASQSGQGAVITSLQLGNNALRPERSREREFGLDLGFLDQRATVGITYFNKRTNDAILPLPINAGQTGATTALRNAATITNRGLEVELNTSILKAAKYSWDFGVQYGRLRNRVVNLAGAQFYPYNTEGFTGAIGSASAGSVVGAIRGSDFVRCGRGLQVNGVAIDQTQGQCLGAPKDALYLGDDGLPILDPTDRVIGDPNPRWTMGFNTQVRYGRFTLSGVADLRRGGEVWNGTRGILYYFGTHRDTDIRTQQGAYGVNWATSRYPNVAGPGVGVVPFQTATDWQNWLQGDGGGFGNVGAQFIENGGFFKLREVGLSVTADDPFVRNRLGLSSIGVRVAGRNLLMRTHYTGFDPESNLGGAEFQTQGLDYFNNPMSRSVVLTVTLNR